MGWRGISILARNIASHLLRYMARQLILPRPHLSATLNQLLRLRQDFLLGATNSLSPVFGYGGLVG